MTTAIIIGINLFLNDWVIFACRHTEKSKEHIYWTSGTEAIWGEVSMPGAGVNLVTEVRYKGIMVAVVFRAILADI